MNVKETLNKNLKNWNENCIESAAAQTHESAQSQVVLWEEIRRHYSIFDHIFRGGSHERVDLIAK